MKAFKTESKKVLDIMINSIYTNKEVFVRELISNASDAIDKLYFASTAEGLSFNRADFKIEIIINKDARTLTVRDTGCGMNDEDLEKNLGVIAHSDSEEFKKAQVEKAKASGDGSGKATADIDIIGQFGVGFYSAFMVSDKITVISRKYNEEKGYIFTSDGSEGYDIKTTKKDTVGTDIIMNIKADTEDEKYGKYLESYELERLIKRYSDYIRYPIILDGKTVNSMVPLWKRSKSEVTEADYNEFYKGKFHDGEDPARVINTSVEGAVSYRSLLFVPQVQPYNFYSKDYEKGLQLYSRGVLIMEKCGELLSDAFGFVKGIVDTEDIALNISREVLQHNRVLKTISTSLEKKIKSELLAMLTDEREKYEKLFEIFGASIKFGLYNSFGAKAELLSDLLLFKSVKTGKYVTLSEYVAGMPEGQTAIYYGAGGSVTAIKGLPQSEGILDKGYDILCFTDHVDEFVAKVLGTYKDKPLKSIQEKDEAEVKSAEKNENDADKDVLTFVKLTLGDKIVKAVISDRLKSHPVCMSTEGEVSIEMEKVFRGLHKDGEIKAQKVLELNKNHAIYTALSTAVKAKETERAVNLVNVLYGSALLIEGLPLDSVSEFVDTLAGLVR